MLSLLPLFLLLPSTSSFSCPPTCPTKAVSPSSCPSGEVVLGPCGCRECARAEREVCGGPWNIDGTCAAGLACLDTKGKETEWPDARSRPVAESQMKGVCRPSCQEASTLGRDYRGTMATTAGGHTCQAWDSSSPHGCGGQPCFPGLKANHCRNPDSEPGGVWCYTTDSSRRWDYCDVPQCSERPVCPQVLCCGSDGTTYPTPCAAPPGVTCVTNTECPPKACPHTDSAWTPWSPCSPSTSCRSSRTRDMVTGCGKECRKETITEEKRCLSCCPLSPSPWTPWSPCPVACGGGVTRRTRDAVLDIQGDCYRQILEQEDTCNLGPCLTTGCPKGCTKIFAPVCGSDGETYANHCELKKASCSSPTHIALEYEGECKEADCDGGDGCCTPASPCGAGEGDCDADSECLPGLTCGKDNCGGGTFEDDDDCCVDRPLEEQTIPWRKGMSPVWLCITPGTNVTFSWTSGHNLMEVDEASYTSCTGLSPTLPAMGPATWGAPRVPGTHYFTCGVPGHCAKGMKATVEVAWDALDCPL